MNASAVDRVQQAFDAIPRSARAARQFVADTLRQHNAAAIVIRDYALVVSELVTNIIEHGKGTTLVVSLDVADPEWWEVEVVGGSSAASPDSLLHPATWSVAGADAISGRGLGIVRHLMDDVVTGTTTGQVSIRCRLRRAPAAT